MLSIWLPLNGNLDNQGLADATVTNHGATVNTSGKIGSCYNFDGSDDYISIDCPDLYKVFSGGSQQFTITFWIYHNDSTRGIIFGDYGLSGTMSFNIELTTDHRIRFYWAGSPDKNFASVSAVSLSNWTHIALTYDGNQILIYKDGVLQTDKYTGTLATKNKTSGVFCLGRDSRTGNTVLNGGINDFRIYNRCLSYRECKSISSGLVVHYPLSMPGQNNILTNTKSFITTSGGGGLTTDTYNGFIIRHLSPRSGSGLRELAYYNNFVKVVSEGMYTQSFWAKGSGKLRCHFYGGNIPVARNITSQGVSTTASDGNCEIMLSPEWKRYWVTHTLKSSSDTPTNKHILLRVMDGDNDVYVCGWKLEEGSIATPWLPNSADPEYAALGLNDGIEYDVSGYKRNGTKIGDITYTSNTSRYSTATHITNGANMRISTPSLSFPNNSITLNIWFRSTNKNATGAYHMVVDSVANRQWYEMCINNSGYLRAGLFVNGTRYADNCTSTTALNGEWHMLTMTYDGTIIKRYFDGVMEKSTSVTASTGLSSPTALILGRDGPNATYACIDVDLSDFRVYATALSADDILELYHTTETLSHNGTLLTQGEYVES